VVVKRGVLVRGGGGCWGWMWKWWWVEVGGGCGGLVVGGGGVGWGGVGWWGSLALVSFPRSLFEFSFMLEC